MRGWFKIALWQRVLGALVIGVIFGGILSRIMGGEAAADWLETFIKPVGDLFINLIRMLIVPLILTTLVSGVVALGDPKKLGSIGLKTMALYFATTFFANIIGIIFGLLFKPGEGVDLGGADAVPVSREAPTLVERLLGIVPDNPIAALADGDVLAIIFFAVLLGVGILMAGREGKLVGDLFTQAANVILKVTHLVMEVAPFGVFALDIFDDALHLVSALWALVAGLIAHRTAKTFLLLFGFLYLADGVMGFVTGSGYLDLGILTYGVQDLPFTFKIMANLPHIGLGGVALLSGLFLDTRR